MRLFFSVGEPSGDLHAANLIRALAARVPLTARGLGGPRMREAGCELLRDMSDLAVMGLWPVLARLPEFLRLRRQVDRVLASWRPDAVVLVDYPGFNWHVARCAKRRGIPVVYYGLPQLWAWASWRVSKVRRWVDHALCKLPFEQAWFAAHGCRATYVGHPYFDELRRQRLDAAFLQRFSETGMRWVTLLPGSRDHEVRQNLPLLLRAAWHIQQNVPGVRFAIASYSAAQAERARQVVARHSVPVEVFAGRTPELIAAATCCLACSGSVSLELLYRAKPAVIVYRVGWATYQVMRHLVNVRYITLANLLASRQPLVRGLLASALGGTWRREPDAEAGEGEFVHGASTARHGSTLKPCAEALEDGTTPRPRKTRRASTRQPGEDAPEEEPLLPEYPTWRDCSDQMAAHAIRWLTDEAARQQVISRMRAVAAQLDRGEASAAAAEYLLRHMAPLARSVDHAASAEAA
jgi:lipid-A-disaccharide synthase